MRTRDLRLALLLLTSVAHPQKVVNPLVKVGDKMPLISVSEPSGATFSLAQESGKVIVVNFWGTWCGPCKLEMPELEKQIWQRYKDSPSFAMIAIATDQSKRTIAKFQKTHPVYTFPLAYAAGSVDKPFAQRVVPRSYVVDRHGIIVYVSVGYGPNSSSNLARAVQSALDQQ